MSLLTALAIGSGIVGAIAGSQKDIVEQSSGVRLKKKSKFEKFLRKGQMDQFGQMRSLVDAGPGAKDVAAGTAAQRDFGQRLAAFDPGDVLPGQEDIRQSQGFAQSIFGAQRVAQQQSFEDQRIQAGRAAAISGRSFGTDPILQAKLAQQQTRQSGLLEAQQGSFASKLALSLPEQRLQRQIQGFQVQGQGVNALQGLGQQALQNRSALFGLGQQALGQEQQFRLASSDRFGTQSSGGGVKGAFLGGMAGLNSGLQIAKGFGGFGGFGGVSNPLDGVKGANITGIDSSTNTDFNKFSDILSLT